MAVYLICYLASYILARFGHYLISGLLLLAAAGFPPVAVAIDAFLARQPVRWDYWASFGVLLQRPKALAFYGVLLAAVLLALIWAIVQGNYLNYRSDMQRLTPKITTPCAAGQGQYGTARWMKPEEVRESFTETKLDELDLDALIRAGKEDKEEIKRAKIDIG